MYPLVQQRSWRPMLRVLPACWRPPRPSPCSAVRFSPSSSSLARGPRMRIASRAVRFVRLDLRASLRPRFVRLVPPGASLPRRGRTGRCPAPPSAPRCRPCRERGPRGCSPPPSRPAGSVVAPPHSLSPACVRSPLPRFIRVDGGRLRRPPSPLSSCLIVVSLPSLARPLAALAGVRWSPSRRGGLDFRSPCVVSPVAVGRAPPTTPRRRSYTVSSPEGRRRLWRA